MFLAATDADAGLREYQKELELNPKHTAALASIALEYETRGELDTAISYARRAVEADASILRGPCCAGQAAG